jgi:catechol 2,3-dioxygenase-like lactoylglutathione lyase family enzyme
MKQRLTFVAFSVSNLARSLRFYPDMIGLPLREESHDGELQDAWYGGPHAAYSWTHGAFIRFALYPYRQPHRPVSTGAQIGFHVSDFEAAHARAIQADVAIVQEPRDEPWGRTARYLDPDGSVVSVTASGL